MTIPVSDAAVEAALTAFLGGEPSEYEREDESKHMRAALAAAMPHLLQEVGYCTKTPNGYMVHKTPLAAGSEPIYRLRTQENADVLP